MVRATMPKMGSMNIMSLETSDTPIMLLMLAIGIMPRTQRSRARWPGWLSADEQDAQGEHDKRSAELRAHHVHLGRLVHHGSDNPVIFRVVVHTLASHLSSSAAKASRKAGTPAKSRACMPKAIAAST